MKKCSKFTGEYPCRSAISLKLKSKFIEMASRYGCSSVNLLHIFRTHFPKNTSGWLLLILVSHAVGLLSLLLKNVSEKVINKKIYLLYKIVHCVKSVHIWIFLWSVFSCIRTENGDLWNKSPDSVRIQENADQKKLLIWTLFTQSVLFLKQKKKTYKTLAHSVLM